MRILDRYIVREILRHALLGLLIFTFVLFVPKLVRLMELFVRHSGSGSQVTTLFLCIIPSILVFTIPMAVLVGVLLGLGRMSMDSEIIALTSVGISRKRILFPVGVIAVLGALLTSLMTMWLAPLSLRTFRGIEGNLLTSQISFQIQPRVFDERFPRMVLYINDVLASGTHWNGVFLAEAESEGSSRITLAENAIVIAEPNEGKLELHLQGGSTHEFSRDDPNSLLRHRVRPERLAHRSHRHRHRQGARTEQSRAPRPATARRARPALARFPRRTAPTLRISGSLPGVRADRASAGRGATPRWSRRRNAALRADHRRLLLAVHHGHGPGAPGRGASARSACGWPTSS